MLKKSNKTDPKPTQKGLEIGNVYKGTDRCFGDPQGSYTGIPCHEKDKPVQDADDL